MNKRSYRTAKVRNINNSPFNEYSSVRGCLCPDIDSSWLVMIYYNSPKGFITMRIHILDLSRHFFVYAVCTIPMKHVKDLKTCFFGGPRHWQRQNGGFHLPGYIFTTFYEHFIRLCSSRFFLRYTSSFIFTSEPKGWNRSIQDKAALRAEVNIFFFQITDTNCSMINCGIIFFSSERYLVQITRLVSVICALQVQNNEYFIIRLV